MYVYVCKCAVKFLLKSRLKLSTKKRKERKKGKRKVRTIIQSAVYRTSYISSYVFFCNYDRFYPKESIDSFAFPHRVGITNRRCSVEIASNDGRGCIYRERERNHF